MDTPQANVSAGSREPWTTGRYICHGRSRTSGRPTVRSDQSGAMMRGSCGRTSGP